MGKETDYMDPSASTVVDALGNPITNPIPYTRIPHNAPMFKTITNALMYSFSRLIQKTDKDMANPEPNDNAQSYACFMCNDIYEEPADFLWHIQACKGNE
ncbi:MAG: hypothetical protein KGH69_01000 [Candidatus Micrarchaeota archaeon]|nr:hypothetical protein [Candidatus Micrarchaeota archaeon]